MFDDEYFNSCPFSLFILLSATSILCIYNNNWSYIMLQFGWKCLANIVWIGDRNNRVGINRWHIEGIISILDSWDFWPAPRLSCWVLPGFEEHRYPSCSGCWRCRWCSSSWLLIHKLLRVPESKFKYLFEVEVLVFLIVVDTIVLLVIQSQTSRVLGSSTVSHGLNKVLAFINNYFVGLGGVIFIFKIEFVDWKGLDGKVGGKNGSILCDDVGSLGNVAWGEVVKIGFICFGHQIWYDYEL